MTSVSACPTSIPITTALSGAGVGGGVAADTKLFAALFGTDAAGPPTPGTTDAAAGDGRQKPAIAGKDVPGAAPDAGWLAAILAGAAPASPTEVPPTGQAAPVAVPTNPPIGAPAAAAIRPGMGAPAPVTFLSSLSAAPATVETALLPSIVDEAAGDPVKADTDVTVGTGVDTVPAPATEPTPSSVAPPPPALVVVAPALAQPSAPTFVAALSPPTAAVTVAPTPAQPSAPTLFTARSPSATALTAAVATVPAAVVTPAVPREAIVSSRRTPMAVALPSPAAGPVALPTAIGPAVAAVVVPARFAEAQAVAPLEPAPPPAGAPTLAIAASPIDRSAAPLPAVDARDTPLSDTMRGPLHMRAAPPAIAAVASPVLARQAVVAAAPPTPSGGVAPAGELFAAAIHAAGRTPAAATRDDPLPIAGSVLAASSFVAAPAAVTGGNADPSLDLRHGNWPGAMIDHIEKLRDAADATDTRIRLIPDALGGIDVSLKRHDDGVAVTLRADHAATQAMIADARPQLTALAEARGIRLSDPDVAPAGTGIAASDGRHDNQGGGLDTGAGTTGGDPSTAGRQPPRPASVIPAAPARAIADDNPDPADRRVA